MIDESRAGPSPARQGPASPSPTSPSPASPGIIRQASTNLIEVAYFAHGPHRHHDPESERFSHPEIIFTLDDRWSIRTRRGRAEAHPGLVVLANPGEEYQCSHFDPVPRDRTLSIAFPGLAGEAAGPLGQWFADQAALPFQPLTIPLTPVLLGYRQAMLAELTDRVPGYRLKLEMLAGAMLVDLARLLGSDRYLPGAQVAGRRGREGVAVAIGYIDQHFAEDLTLATLADLAGISRFHFSHLFKAVSGQSPYQYLLQKRLEQAGRLLQETDLPITEIAMQVGFDDVTHFARAFRRGRGLPPGVLRQGQQD